MSLAIYLTLQIHQYPDDNLWIGATADNNGQFYWTDGNPFNFVNWDKGQPDNYYCKFHKLQGCITRFHDVDTIHMKTPMIHMKMLKSYEI